MHGVTRLLMSMMADSTPVLVSEVAQVQSRFAETRFAETPTLILTLNPNPLTLTLNPKP